VTAQLSLVYKPSHVGAEVWAKQLEAIRSAVNYLGLKEVAFELDVSGSSLCDALNERDRKRWAAEWTHVLKAMLASKRDAIADDMLRALLDGDVATTPFDITEPVELTSEELAAAYARELRALGEPGQRAMAKVHRGGRRSR